MSSGREIIERVFWYAVRTTSEKTVVNYFANGGYACFLDTGQERIVHVIVVTARPCRRRIKGEPLRVYAYIRRSIYIGSVIFEAILATRTKCKNVLRTTGVTNNAGPVIFDDNYRTINNDGPTARTRAYYT